ncbi:hypothetical protein F5146DRAFT_1105686 [Armillaria mellea]|nr:hypothetical protein F5146DRAFT_1105686 [Armillaria mellea]
MMEIFHTAILHYPQLSVQAFVWMLCDLHHYPIAGGLQEQFSICYDVFITILNNVELRVIKELSRSDPNWQLKNCCAACTFELEGEEELELHVVDVDRWSKEAIGDVKANMSDEHTSKMWGVFEEIGFFLSLCHHGSMLVSADMVRSGEQAKYSLAVVARLLQVFGDHLGIGYDIGCKFGSTVHQSPLRELAKTKLFCMLVGLFHGHAHNYLCQLRHLGTYLKGLGLEDLKTLEHFFSKLNALAGGIHYASHFHYIIDSYPALQKSMQELGVTDEKEFEAWLREEEVYLSNLQCEPPNDTHKMEMSQELERVQDLEHLLNISPDEQWTVGLEKWKENEQRVATRTYRHYLDRLEGLVVACIFELTKMNMSHTALKACSQAIRTALNQYNTAAAALSPPRLLLQWDCIIEYDMSHCKWATPAGQQAMDTYFKIC